MRIALKLKSNSLERMSSLKVYVTPAVTTANLQHHKKCWIKSYLNQF